jgi:hypothetical protein
VAELEHRMHPAGGRSGDLHPAFMAFAHSTAAGKTRAYTLCVLASATLEGFGWIHEPPAVAEAEVPT